MKLDAISGRLVRHGAKAVSAMLLLGASALAQAAIVWTLDDAAFSDGGVATGSFTYDPDTGTFGDFSISVSGGDTDTFAPFVFDNTTVTFAYLGQPALGDFNFFFETGSARQLRIPVVSVPTSAGGTVALNLSSAFGADCFNCSPFRTFVSGSINGSTGGGGGGGTPAIPEPASWAMMIAGFGLVGGMMRRRRDALAA